MKGFFAAILKDTGSVHKKGLQKGNRVLVLWQDNDEPAMRQRPLSDFTWDKGASGYCYQRFTASSVNRQAEIQVHRVPQYITTYTTTMSNAHQYNSYHELMTGQHGRENPSSIGM